MAIFSLIRISYIFCKYRLDELFDPLANKILLSVLFFFPRIFFRKRKGIEHRLSDALEEMGPLFIKFGQLLSTRPDLVGEKQASVLKKFQNNLKPFINMRGYQNSRARFGKSYRSNFRVI
jgi:ubiquinone biosynthesis protein